MVRHPYVVRMHQSDHMPVVEAATLLGESRWTVLRRINAGQLDAEKIGNTYILSRQQVTEMARLRAEELAAAAALATERAEAAAS